MCGQGHGLGGCAFVLPTLGRELVEPEDAMQQFFQLPLDLKEEDAGGLPEVKCVGGSPEPAREAINPQTKEVLSLRAKMTWNHSYCQRSFNPARRSCDVKSLGFDRFVALTA
tara:strand:- start:812 stop:1147 length:336 start_codon:yes stop_codon:yes gene_type:complete